MQDTLRFVPWTPFNQERACAGRCLRRIRAASHPHFLTLEGIGGRVDPDFNIYEMAMPWAVRRSLSPSSADGMQALRSTLLTPDNRVQWDRLLDLVADATASSAPPAPAATAEVEPVVDAAGDAAGDADSKAASNEAAKASAMNDAVGSSCSPSAAGPAPHAQGFGFDRPRAAARLQGRACPATRPPWVRGLREEGRGGF